MVKMSNTLTTKVAIDTITAQNSLKGLKTAVSAVTNSWKAQEANLRSSGDALQAAEARYNGLGNAMRQQQTLIDGLKQKQSELKGTTNENSESYLKYEKQIASAENKLQSLSAQQERSKSSLEYQKSGLAELQSSYASMNKVSSSYVERLKAEGKETAALKERQSALGSSAVNLKEQYAKQADELAQLAESTGKSSSAYQTQKIRANETATALAKTRSELTEVNEKLRKTPSGFLSGVKEKLTGINEKAERTSNLFSKVLGANLVSNGITSALGAIQAHFSELSDAVKEYDDKQQTMLATWNTLTGSAKKGKAMVDMGNQLSVAFGQNINIVDELNQQFYHVLNNEPATKKLTSSVLTMADAVGLSSENTKNLGLNFTHMMSSSLLQLGDFNHITDALPMYGEALLKYEQKVQKNSKLTMAELRDEMSAGKISAKDAQTVMEQLGGKYQEASENLMKTAPGMVRQIKAQAPALLDAVVSPIRKMRNPFLGQISKWVGDKNTKQEFADLGSTLVFQVERITKAFGGAKKINIGDILDKAIFKLHTGINTLGNVIVENKGNIKDLTSAFKSGGTTGIKVFTQTLKDLEPVIKLVGNAAAKHPKTFAKVAASMLVASKAATVLKPAVGGLIIISQAAKWASQFSKANRTAAAAQGTLTAAQKAFNLVAKANPIGLVVTAIVALAAGFIYAYKHIKPFRDAVNGLGKSMKKLFTGKYGWEKTIGKKLSSVGNTISKWGKSAGKFVSKHKTEILAGIVSPFAGLSAWFLKDTKTGRNVTKWAQGFAKDVQKMGLRKAFDKQVNDAGKAFNKSKFGKWWNNVSSSFNSWKKSFNKSWSRHWDDATRTMSNDWNKSVKNTKNFFGNVNKNFNSFKKSFSKSWNNHWNSTKNNMASNWNQSVKNTGNFFGNVNNKWNSFKKSFSRTWNDHWNNAKNTLGSAWTKSLRSTSNFGGNMLGWFDKFNSKFTGGWQGMTDGIKNIFSKMWSSIKKHAGNGINGMLDIVNGGISGIDSLLKKFGADKNVIGTIGHVKFANGGIVGGEAYRNIIVNDGFDSPETDNREMITYPDGHSEIPTGHNVSKMVPVGAVVTKASETAPILKTHFADGGIVGGFESIVNGITGAVSKAAGLVKVAQKIITDPMSSIKALTNFKTDSIAGDTPKGLAKGMFKSTTTQVTDWWKELWSQIKDAATEGSAEGGNWAHSPGSGWSVTSGFGNRGAVSGGYSQHDGVDFSGAKTIHAVHGGKVIRSGGAPAGWGGASGIGQNIVTKGDDGYYVIYQEFNGKNNSGAPTYVNTGDDVKTGGKIAGLGSSGTHVHIGVSKHNPFSISGTSTSGWLNLLNMTGSTSGSKKKSVNGKHGLLTPLWNNLSGVFKWVAKFLSPIMGDDAGGSEGNPSGSGVKRWADQVKKALKANGLSTSQALINKVLRQINTESGGNPNAVGGNDGLADGNATGLMQTKPGTFRANAFPGHGDIMNGYDNLLAALHYAKKRYGSSLSFLGQGHGYANGGIVGYEQFAHIAEGNQPESIIPWDISKRSRAYELLAKTMAHFKQQDGGMTSSAETTQADVSGLEKRLDTLINLFTQLLGINGQQLQAMRKSGNLNDLYKIMGNDQIMSDFQAL